MLSKTDGNIIGLSGKFRDIWLAENYMQNVFVVKFLIIRIKRENLKFFPKNLFLKNVRLKMLLSYSRIK